MPTLRVAAVVFFLVVVLAEVQNTEGRVVDDSFKKCGIKAKQFLAWFCDDETFDLPFPYRHVHIVLRYPPPRRELYPFQHQYSLCCKRGCRENEYEKLCHYHRQLQAAKTRGNHHTKEGREFLLKGV